jgi:bifunctional DNA-binding transcriptional regulator/antitoxin component of YhaV-PrlF toxin-antitoxin module
MKTASISSGGQISIPGNVRRRWGTRRVSVEDQGNALVIRPIPSDPIGAAIGSLAGRAPSTDEMRAELREAEAAADLGKRNSR